VNDPQRLEYATPKTKPRRMVRRTVSLLLIAIAVVGEITLNQEQRYSITLAIPLVALLILAMVIWRGGKNVA
jgi:hypothetical protein